MDFWRFSTAYYKDLTLIGELEAPNDCGIAAPAGNMLLCKDANSGPPISVGTTMPAMLAQDCL